jgi:hypothetical protein
MTKIFALRLAFGICLLAVSVMALSPANDVPRVFAFDKLNHVLAFSVLAFLASWLWPRKAVFIPLGLLTAYGTAIEILQGIMGLGRDADWMDLGADVLAIYIGLLLAQFARFANRRWARLN